MALHTETIGAGPRLVFAHGFTQNRRCWGPLIDHLSEAFEVVLVDLPGHGRSGHDDADLWAASRLLGEVGGDATYVGYSMGGRVALHLALRQPERVDGLVLIGATAGIDDPAERSARRAADEARAAHLGEVGLEVFIDEWLALPLFAGLDEVASARAERLTNRASGLQASLRHCGTGTQTPCWSELVDIEAPTLVVAGSDDTKFTAIGRRLAGEIGANARFVEVPGTHAVHLEEPHQVGELISTSVTAWRTA